MRFVKELQASDIDTDKEPLHSFLMMALTMNMVTWPRDVVDKTNEEIIGLVKGQVALFLNMVETSEFTFAPKDSIPEAFKF